MPAGPPLEAKAGCHCSVNIAGDYALPFNHFCSGIQQVFAMDKNLSFSRAANLDHLLPRSGKRRHSWDTHTFNEKKAKIFDKYGLIIIH